MKYRLSALSGPFMSADAGVMSNAAVSASQAALRPHEAYNLVVHLG
jgi:hypothetical protein